MANYRWFCFLCLAVSGPLYADDKQTQIDIIVQAGRFAEAETLLRRQIRVKPANWDAHFRLAKVLSWQKKFKEAEFEYQMLLAREPHNTDYLLGLAQVCFWRGDARTALPLIETAQSLTPGDPDIWRLHIQALATINDATSHQQALIVQQQAARRFPELKWTIVTSAKPNQPVVTPEPRQATADGHDLIFDLIHRNQVELGGSYEHLSKNRGYWRSEYLSFEHRFAPRQVVYGTFTQTERFGLNDEQFLLGGYYPLSPKLTLNMEGNVSPSPQVLASNSIMASLQAGLGYNAFLTGGFRHSEYGTGPMQQGFATLETYFSDFRAAYTVRVTDSLNRTQFGHSFNFSYYYQDISFITLSYSMGAESSGFQGVILDTQSFALYGRHWLNQDWALTWTLGHIEQGSAYNRDGVSLGIRRAF
jgi:YaiO family outer membrane protein